MCYTFYRDRFSDDKENNVSMVPDVTMCVCVCVCVGKGMGVLAHLCGELCLVVHSRYLMFTWQQRAAYTVELEQLLVFIATENCIHCRTRTAFSLPSNGELHTL